MNQIYNIFFFTQQCIVTTRNARVPIIIVYNDDVFFFFTYVRNTNMIVIRPKLQMEGGELATPHATAHLSPLCPLPPLLPLPPPPPQMADPLYQTARHE